MGDCAGLPWLLQLWWLHIMGSFTYRFGEKRGSLAKSDYLGALATAVVATLVAVGVLRLVEVRPAEATFPGKNGKIAFQSDRGGSYEIYTMNRNGKRSTNSLPTGLQTKILPSLRMARGLPSCAIATVTAISTR